MVKDNQFLYKQIYSDIVHKINSATLVPGDKLPTEMSLCAEYNCSRATIRRALGLLEKEGYIYRKSGTGTFISYNKLNYSLNKLEGFSEQMNKRNSKPSSELLYIEMLNAENVDSAVSESLDLTFNEKIYKVGRLRYSDSTVMAYEIAYIKEHYCPNLQKYLENSASLYDIYENKYQLKMDYGDVTLEAINASNEISKILKIKTNDPLLLMNCTVRLDNGDTLYHVVCYYIGEKYVFSVRQYR